MKNNVYLLLIFTLLLGSCVSHSHNTTTFGRITFGMSKAQVRAQIGPPERILLVRSMPDGFQEVLQYRTPFGDIIALEFWNDRLVGYERLYDGWIFIPSPRPPFRPPFGQPVFPAPRPPRPQPAPTPSRPTPTPTPRPPRPGGVNPTTPTRPNPGSRQNPTDPSRSNPSTSSRLETNTRSANEENSENSGTTQNNSNTTRSTGNSR